PSFEQELSYRRVFGQTDCPVEGLERFRGSPQALQEVSANRPIWLITGNRFSVDGIQYREAGFRSVRFGYRCGVAGARSERWRYADELLVEQHNRTPLRSAATRPLSVHRLNRGLKLEPAGATALRSLAEMLFRLLD